MNLALMQKQNILQIFNSQLNEFIDQLFLCVSIDH